MVYVRLQAAAVTAVQLYADALMVVMVFVQQP